MPPAPTWYAAPPGASPKSRPIGVVCPVRAHAYRILSPHENELTEKRVRGSPDPPNMIMWCTIPMFSWGWMACSERAPTGTATGP